MPMATSGESRVGVLYGFTHLVYLSPLTGLLLHEARVNSWHDLVEVLAGNIIERVVDWAIHGLTS